MSIIVGIFPFLPMDPAVGLLTIERLKLPSEGVWPRVIAYEDMVARIGSGGSCARDVLAGCAR